jgi:hypothetical protein
MSEPPNPQELVTLVRDYHLKYIQTPKFTDGDLTAEPLLMDAAIDYLKQYEGRFEFLRDMKSKFRGTLSIPQARGVLNTMLAEARRQDNPLEDTPYQGLLLNGFFANEHFPTIRIAPWEGRETEQVRMVQVLNPLNGKWEGVATVNPNFTYRIWGRHNNDEVKAYLNNFFTGTLRDRGAWNQTYAELTGNCYICGNNPAETKEGTVELSMCQPCEQSMWDNMDEAQGGATT